MSTPVLMILRIIGTWKSRHMLISLSSKISQRPTRPSTVCLQEAKCARKPQIPSRRRRRRKRTEINTLLGFLIKELQFVKPEERGRGKWCLEWFFSYCLEALFEMRKTQCISFSAPFIWVYGQQTGLSDVTWLFQIAPFLFFFYGTGVSKKRDLQHLLLKKVFF